MGLTTLTPLTEMQVELHQVFYWTIPWLTLIRPLVRHFVRTFIQQDHDVVEKQQHGLNDDPQLMLINDADKPARWYYQLKRNSAVPRRTPLVHQSRSTHDVALVYLTWLSS